MLTAPSPELAIGLLRRSHRRPAAVIADYHLDGCTGTDAIGMGRVGFGPDIAGLVITADRTPTVQREIDRPAFIAAMAGSTGARSSSIAGV